MKTYLLITLSFVLFISSCRNPPEVMPLHDLKSTRDTTNKLIKVYAVKAQDMDIYDEHGGKIDFDRDLIMSKYMDNMYSKEIYKNYLDEMSFNKLSMDFIRGEFLEIPSYPLEQDEQKSKAYGHKIIDTGKLSEMMLKIIPREDLLKYEPIVLNLITSYDVRYYVTGVTVPHGLEEDVTAQRSFFMFQMNNQDLMTNLRAIKEETLIGSTKGTIMHELFHTFGFFRHANSFSDKTIIPYGNVFDVLGYSSLSVNLNPAIRDYFNWLDDSNTIYINTKNAQSKNITLHALNGNIGQRVLKIATNEHTSYYIYFMGDDKWFITNLNKNEDYESYTGFTQKLTKEAINTNKKGIFVLKEDGASNTLIGKNGSNVIPSYMENDIYKNEFFVIDNIHTSKDNKTIDFNVKINKVSQK